MALFGKRSGPSVDEFAKELATDIANRYPAELEKSVQKRMSVNRVTDLLEDVFAKAQTFKNENSLGWFKKAKLGNSFRWDLKERGYSEEFIEMATEGLIVYITRKAAPAPTPK